MMAGNVSKTEVLFLRMVMAKPNTQRVQTRNKVTEDWDKRMGAGKRRYDYFLVLYINGVKTRVKVPVRSTDGLREGVVKINRGRYFFQEDTERVGR